MECGKNNSGIIIAINIIIILIISIYIIKNFNNSSKVTNIALTLVISGGIGNLIDRIFRGYVIDYIDINNIFEFPIFNLADIFIVIGIAIMIIYIILESLKKQEKV